MRQYDLTLRILAGGIGGDKIHGCAGYFMRIVNHGLGEHFVDEIGVHWIVVPLAISGEESDTVCLELVKGVTNFLQRCTHIKYVGQRSKEPVVLGIFVFQSLAEVIASSCQTGRLGSLENSRTGSSHYATGFDALTGSYEEIDYYGEGVVTLNEVWKDGPQTYLGIMVPGFPNMFNILGPHQGTGNIPHAIEYAVGFVTRLMQHLKVANVTYIVPDQEGVKKWTKHVFDCTEGVLSANVNSWMTGYNSNKKGRGQRGVVRYFGGLVKFRQQCEDVAADNYRHFVVK
ncbi:uncharacterized protein BJX67DRAFT_384082 [Aspergillus lucknowensis]|uniref:Uncharacterized protein n=1 Tax=Aspergillus lucknowensis TaxID=176173 RepID=A0ABR4LHU0_9EURO